MVSHSDSCLNMTPRSDIAIIGFSFIFTHANSTESFWELLISGRCASSEFPSTRFRNITSHGGGNDRTANTIDGLASFLHGDIGEFDARFFGMTPEEAAATDPQQRLLLETTYRALENAGITTDSIKGSDTSVYTGCFTADYAMNAAKDADNLPKYSATGLAGSLLSNRISTFFDLTGPSMTIDTACSSSLVALDIACQSLMSGQSNMSIVTGSNLLLTKDLFISLSSLGFLSPDGICHSFDSQANGYGRGEGIAALIIKPVETAIRDGDTIRAVIRAIGTNQNGHTNLAQPSKKMQRDLIENTYRKANIEKSQTRFFEAHGTGTASGDPLEAGAIGDVFRPGRDRSDPLIVGSVKSNIGHLEGAAGIAGVIKTILVLENGIIPPISGLNKLNENIDADFLNLKFPDTPIPWPQPGLRRASVNSFGFGGTNAHAILDDAFHYLKARGLVGKHRTSVQLLSNPTPDPCQKGESTSHGRPLLFVWSAGDQKVASHLARCYQEYLEKGIANNEVSQDYFVILAHTLAQRRTLHSWRIFAVATSISNLIEKLITSHTPIASLSNRSAAFIFTGQGAQWAGMGRELFSYTVFRDSIDEADSYLETIGCFWRASDLYRGRGTQPDIHEPRFAQPLCTILQVALVDLLHSFGIYPVISIGHSSGEIAAAYSTGAICRRSAWKLAYFRGLLSSKLAESSQSGFRGAMMAVGTHEASLRPYLEEILSTTQGGVLSMACFNSYQSITVAGDELLVQTLQTKLEKDGIFARVLKVPVAYHTSHMISIATGYQQLIGNLSRGQQPSQHFTMISSVTGENISAYKLREPEYRVNNMVSPVRFKDAIQRLYQNFAKNSTKKIDLSHRNYTRVSDMVEIGPHSVLGGAIRDISKTISSSAQISYTSPLMINLGLVNNLDHLQDLSRALTTLPEYPYDHSQVHWSESRIAKNSRLYPYPYSEFLGCPVADWNPLEPRWRNILRKSSISWLEDHQGITQILEGRTIVRYELKDVQFFLALVIPQSDKGVEVQFDFKLLQDTADRTSSWASFSLFLCDENFTEICRGLIKASIFTENSPEGYGDVSQIRYVRGLMETTRSYYGTEMCFQDFYAALRKDGYQYGPSFQGVRHLFWSDQDQAVAGVSTNSPNIDSPSKRFSVLHPCTLDSILQLCVSRSTERGLHSKDEISNLDYDRITQISEVQVYIKRDDIGSRRKISSIYAVGTETDSWLFEAEGIETTLITDDIQELTTDQSPIKVLCYDMIFKPDIYLASPGPMLRYLQDHSHGDSQNAELLSKLKLFILVSLSRAIDMFDISSFQTVEAHLKKHYAWARSQISAAKKHPPLDIPSHWMKYVEEPLFDDLRNYLKAYTGPLGKLYAGFETHLIEVFQGQRVAAEVFDQSNIIDGYYNLLSSDSNFHHPLCRYIDTLSHKNPAMRILQLGASPVSISKLIRSQLISETSNGPVCRFSRYDIADSSESALKPISDGADTDPKIQLHVFDFRERSINEIFETGSYDLIIVPNILRTTNSLLASLRNLRELLRDGGKLLVIDFITPDSMIGRPIFGFFPEWWYGDYNAFENRWSTKLKKSGFAGIDFTFRDSNIEGNHLSTIFVSSTIRSPLNLAEAYLTQRKEVLVVSAELVHSNDSSFSEAGNQDTESKLIVIPEEYASFHGTVEKVPSSEGVSPISLVQGLARTLRMENSGQIFATVGIDTSQTAALGANIEHSLRNFLRGVHSGHYEPELVQIGDMLHIPRVYGNNSLNRQPFGKSDTRLKVRQAGLLDTLYFEQTSYAGPLASDEIEVRIKAVGRIPDDKLGCECSGVVVGAGSNCNLRPGDHVLVCGLDTFRSLLRCKELLAVKIPDGMTLTSASSLAVNFITAYHSLVVIARLSPGESVLVHSGAGGTRQAAIQIAKFCGAQVFTTVGSPEKKELLNTLYDIPLGNILNSRDLSFASGIKRLTQAGDALVASWGCVASFGRFIEIGKKDIISHNKLQMHQFARNVSFSAVDIAAMVSEKPRLIRDALVAISDMFNRNILLEYAFLVVEINPDDVVPVTAERISSWKFGPKETFVIAGGLGGQGRSISKWMVSKGARNLVLLSRTGPKDDRSRSFVRNLERNGATIYTPKCDITDPESLGEVLNHCSRNMPPIKGCIQAAMDIKDSMFSNMSFGSWISSLKPKIVGSWNLHQQLPRALDFFIMFSSVSGIIGSQGQSNYATGNTFQDGLAQYRLSRGEKAISLDLGILPSDGYIAENKEALLRFMNIKQMLPIEEVEVLSLLEIFCDRSLPIDLARSQVVIGLELPANVISRGMEPSNWMHEPMFANLHQMTSTTGGKNEHHRSGPSLADQLTISKELGETIDILANGLAMRLSAIFSLPRESFDLNQPLHTYGVDSLIAVELRNWFVKVLKVDLAIFEILGGATATTLAKVAAEKMRI
ncbi:putative polyketide synthase [Annulohypoxylon nitens]|nr:putative polyketide synthase [Annulohypoxylon nitens]